MTMTKADRPHPMPTPGDILGVPVLPPGRATMATNRIRSLVGRIHAAMGPPPVQILEGLFGLLDHRVLVVLCRLGVPDALTSPIPPDELARALGADPVRLTRLLRYASTRGWVRIDRRGRVRPTRVTAFLRSDHPGGWSAWVEFAGGDEIGAAVGALTTDPSVTDAFAEVNGRPFFEWMVHHPERWATFDRAMAAGGRMHALALAAAVDWDHTRQVCDVGGGTGDLLAALLELVPSISGTAFDLPDVIGRALEHDRLTAVGGDALVEVPAGFDTYLLVNVLHDWDDDDARRILERVGGAMSDRSRLIVVDNDHQTVPRDRLPVCTDVLMAALTNGGRERNAGTFAALGHDCGLHLTRTTRLATADLAHEFRLAPSSRLR
jgi:hypothetical protein